jgi:uncharacterized membrane protein YgdD (TMEM256/DUF423 family)
MRVPWISSAAAILVVLFAAELTSGFGGLSAVRYVDDLGTLAAALAASIFCSGAARRQRGRLRTFWTLLAAAVGSWALGELLWAVYDLAGRGPVPVPSWADAAYLSAVPLAAAALLAHPALHGRAIGKIRALLDGSALAASLFFVAWSVVLGPLWRSTDLTTAGGLITLAYPAGDVLLLFLIALVIRGTTDRDRRDLWFLLAGLVGMTISDAVYAYLVEVAGYATGNYVDIGWVAGYLAIAAGAHAARPQPATDPLPRTRTLTRAALLAPFVPVLAALSLAAVQIQLHRRLDRVAWAAAVFVVGAVLFRQALLAVDLYRGSERDEGLPSRLLRSLEGTQP